MDILPRANKTIKSIPSLRPRDYRARTDLALHVVRWSWLRVVESDIYPKPYYLTTYRIKFVFPIIEV